MQKVSAICQKGLDSACVCWHTDGIHCGQALDKIDEHEALFSCAPWGGNTPKPGRTERSRKGPFCVLGLHFGRHGVQVEAAHGTRGWTGFGVMWSPVGVCSGRPKDHKTGAMNPPVRGSDAAAPGS